MVKSMHHPKENHASTVMAWDADAYIGRDINWNQGIVLCQEVSGYFSRAMSGLILQVLQQENVSSLPAVPICLPPKRYRRQRRVTH